MEENLKKIKYFLDLLDETIDENIEVEEIEIKELRQAIENLIKGYKELKEKIKEQQKQLNIANKKILSQKGQIKVINTSYIPKSKVRKKIEERFGKLCIELGSYEIDNATPEKERIAGGINELRKLKNELLEERN